MQYQKTIWKKGDCIKSKALNNLEDGVANNTACLNEFSQGFDCLNEALNALTDSTTSLGEEVKNLSSNLSGGKNNEEIVAQVNALLEKVDTLETSYNALTAEISSLQEQDETALSKLADLSTRLGEMKTSLENKDTELEAKDNEIQGNVNTLKEEVTGSVSLLEKNVSDVHETSLINSLQLKALNELIRYKDSGQEIKFQEGQNAIISEQPVSLNNVRDILAGKTYFIRTFGCQMNQHDSERVSGLLDSYGCLMALDPEHADIVVFMTCCVREAADTRLYGQCNSCKSLPPSPSGKRVVAVGGCIAQRDGEGLLTNVDNVNVIFGTHSIAHVAELIAEAFLDGKRHIRTNEQAADGWGEGFEQREIRVDGKSELYASE